MAELSEQTKAIIERLKAEGQLTRNTGTNSIRSVKIQLDRFEGIFNTISTNIVEQTSMMRTQLGIAQEAAERAETREQLQELDPPTSQSEAQSRTDETIDKIGDGLGKTIDGLFNLNNIKNMALAGAGLFVGYNLIKGYVNEQTDGGFDRMVDGIKNTNWKEMSDQLNIIKWSSFASAVNNASTKINDFTKWIDETGVDDVVSAVVGGGLVAAGVKGAVSGVLAGGGTGLKGRLASLPAGLALATAGIAVYYGDEIAGWLKEAGASEEGAEGLTDAAAMALGLSAMFGPKGALIGAVAATAIMLGGIIDGWIKKQKDKAADEFNRQIAESEAIIEQANIENRQLEEQERQKVAQALAESRRRQQLALSEAAIGQAAAAEAAMIEALGQERLPTDGGGINSAQRDRIVQDIMNGKQGAMEELLAFARSRENERFDISRKYGASRDEWIDEFLEDFAKDTFYDLDAKGYNPTEALASMDKWKELVGGSRAKNVQDMAGKYVDDLVEMGILNGITPMKSGAAAFNAKMAEGIASGAIKDSPVIIFQNSPTFIGGDTYSTHAGNQATSVQVLGPLGDILNGGDTYGMPK